MIKLWNVYRYESHDGQPIPETRTALMMPLPDKAGCVYLAKEGNKLAADEGANYIFRVEQEK